MMSLKDLLVIANGMATGVLCILAAGLLVAPVIWVCKCWWIYWLGVPG